VPSCQREQWHYLVCSNSLCKESLVGYFSLYAEFKGDWRVLIMLEERVYIAGYPAVATKVFKI
jgi:hypothetical protein